MYSAKTRQILMIGLLLFTGGVRADEATDVGQQEQEGSYWSRSLPWLAPAVVTVACIAMGIVLEMERQALNNAVRTVENIADAPKEVIQLEAVRKKLVRTYRNSRRCIRIAVRQNQRTLEVQRNLLKRFEELGVLNAEQYKTLNLSFDLLGKNWENFEQEIEQLNKGERADPEVVLVKVGDAPPSFRSRETGESEGDGFFATVDVLEANHL